VTPIGNSTRRQVSVTDGRRTLGSVVERDDGFAAIDVAGHTVGVYQTEPDAASALWRWCVHQRDRVADPHDQLEGAGGR
jgi:hypothetical protein